jgi:hypothetical protein
MSLLQLEALRELQLIELNEIRGTTRGTAHIDVTMKLKLAKSGRSRIRGAALGRVRGGGESGEEE